MQQVMNKIDLNNLDKSTWEPFKFDEIASKVSETVDPNKTDIPIYIGLEHIDADDIHIRRQGTPDDVNGQKLKCYPGDVIFGKRRAYQRKAAIVDFEGICSAHAFVLRANPEVIDPQLFPFFLHSDQFMHRMIDISVGGLSPTINWGDLKHQEFLLPPKDQQAQLAELLWAMDEVILNDKRVLEKTRVGFHSKMDFVYNNKSKKLIKLKNRIELTTGKRMKGGGLVQGEVLSIGGENIDNYGNIIFDRCLYITQDFYDSMKNGIIKINDILLMKDGAKTGKIAFVDKDIVAATNEHLFIIRANEKLILQKFLFYFLMSDFGQSQIRSFFHGIIGGVTKDDVYDLKLAEYEITEQSLLISLFDNFFKSIFQVEYKLSSSQSLQKSIINQIF
jgi:restriction endonuclease S subunit